jgi:hypothetical protein
LDNSTVEHINIKIKDKGRSGGSTFWHHNSNWSQKVEEAKFLQYNAIQTKITNCDDLDYLYAKRSHFFKTSC